jgi:hypothetical protein
MGSVALNIKGSTTKRYLELMRARNGFVYVGATILDRVFPNLMFALNYHYTTPDYELAPSHGVRCLVSLPVGVVN